jgi:light-harvesting protein B-800-850 alpha chain
MNQGRIWCVVSPTVGLPLLLGSVAVTALIVHAEVLSHTTWFSGYWQGASKTKTADIGDSTKVASTAQPAYVLSIAPVAGTSGTTESSFVVTVAPNPAVTAMSEQTPLSKTVAMVSPKTE